MTSQQPKFPSLTLEQLCAIKQKEWPHKTFAVRSTNTTPTKENQKPLEGTITPVESSAASPLAATPIVSAKDNNKADPLANTAATLEPFSPALANSKDANLTSNVSDDVAVAGTFDMQHSTHTNAPLSGRPDTTGGRPVSPKYEKRDLEKLRDDAVEPSENLKAKVASFLKKSDPTIASNLTWNTAGINQPARAVARLQQPLASTESSGTMTHSAGRGIGAGQYIRFIHRLTSAHLCAKGDNIGDGGNEHDVALLGELFDMICLYYGIQ